MDGSAAVDPAACDSASCFVLGVTIAGVAAFLYASGLCVQRAALTGVAAANHGLSHAYVTETEASRTR